MPQDEHHAQGRKKVSPTDRTLLFAESGNCCAFPGCKQPLVLRVDGLPTLVGQAAHIYAASPNGPRYRADMTEEERAAESNLIALCPMHHLHIDRHPNEYLAETLKEWKDEQTKQSKPTRQKYEEVLKGLPEAKDAPHQPYNQYLTRVLIEALAAPYGPWAGTHDETPICAAARPWLRMFDRDGAQWYREYRPKMQKLIREKLDNPFGERLQELLSTGLLLEENRDTPRHGVTHLDYIQHCHFLALHVVQLLNYALLAHYGQMREAQPQLPPLPMPALDELMALGLPINLEEHVVLLDQLLSHYEECRLACPIPELTALPQNGRLHEMLWPAAKDLQQLKNQASGINPDQLAAYCPMAERLLAKLLAPLAFLARYRLTSLKQITYQKVHQQAHYLHYTQEVHQDEQTVNWTGLQQEPPYPQSLMLHQEDEANYAEGINLYPFVIDMHSIDDVEGTAVLYLNQVNHLNEAMPSNAPVDDSRQYKAKLVYYREVPFKNLADEATRPRLGKLEEAEEVTYQYKPSKKPYTKKPADWQRWRQALLFQQLWQVRRALLTAELTAQPSLTEPKD